MDAPPDYDPMPALLAEMDRIGERLRSQPGWKPPTPEQQERGRRAFEDAIERIRAERQALRDFTAFVEAELAAGKSLAEIGEMPGRA